MTRKGMVSCLLLIYLASLVKSHGRLIEPPSRASAWRFGFTTPIDYNDNQGFCGGFNHQYTANNGRCGICGDAWELDPRPHEVGGRYATGTIVRKYSAGETITVQVDVTANHKGHFQFKICPNNNINREVTQECLDQYPLELSDGSGCKYWINSKTGVHSVQVKLPENLTCRQCVLQWCYVAGNNWGTCENGTGAVGCGPQEEFRACADVAISNNSTRVHEDSSSTQRRKTHHDVHHNQHRHQHGSRPRIHQEWTVYKNRPNGPSSEQQPMGKHPLTSNDISTPGIHTKVSTGRVHKDNGTKKKCSAVGIWKRVAGMDTWCQNNCLHTPSFCPKSHCGCS